MSTASSRASVSPPRSWGQGPFDNDIALAVVHEQQRRLVEVVQAFCTEPEPESFARAHAALELLVLHAANPLVPIPREAAGWRESILIAFDGALSAHYRDMTSLRAQRKALESRVERLAERARSSVPAAAPLSLRSALERQAESARQDYLFPFEELLGWLEPVADDAVRAWTECPRADHMLAIAQACGAPQESLRALLQQLLEPVFASLPGDAPRHEVEALEGWAVAAVRGGDRARVVLAQRARAAAHLLRAEPGAARNHLGLALKVVLDAAALEAAIAAERAGASREAAMTDVDGPGWRAYRATNRALAERLRALAPELPRQRGDHPGLCRARG